MVYDKYLFCKRCKTGMFSVSEILINITRYVIKMLSVSELQNCAACSRVRAAPINHVFVLRRL